MTDKQKEIAKLIWTFRALREEHILKLCKCTENDINYVIATKAISKDKNTKILKYQGKEVNNRMFDDMYNVEKFTTTLYREGEKLDGICDITTAFIIIRCVDKELTNRTKIFQTDQITINSSSEDIRLNISEREKFIRRTKKIFETQEKIDEEQVEFIVDFNNGTKLQIYEPDNNPTSRIYGIVIIDGIKNKNVEIPVEIILQIRYLCRIDSY